MGKAKTKLAIVLVLVCVMGALAACAPSSSESGGDAGEPAASPYADGKVGNKTGFDPEGPYIENIDQYPEAMDAADRNARNAEANKPSTYTDQFGFTVQPVPADPKGFNMTYLNAENRGCLSCHTTIEDALMSMDTWHTVGAMGYPTQLTVANCIGCHYSKVHGDQRPMSSNMHGIHNGKEGFIEMGGTCDSCHFVDGNGDFQMWDYVKYDQYRGITDLTAEEASLSVSYDQETITPDGQIFFEGMRQGSDPASWMTDDENYDEALADSWVVTIDGEVENPIEMTVTELVEKFGTETVVAKQNCLANGVAGGWIYQAEFTGVPISAILDYVKPAEGVQQALTVSADGAYQLNLPIKYYEIENALLVTEMNGKTLPPSQGYPVATCFPGTSSGYMVKQLEHITFSSDPTPMGKMPIGQLVKDPQTGTAIGLPNSAVLSHPDGVLLEGQAGKELTFEGYADGWDEPISKIEFSLDHGKTWTEVEMTEDYDLDKWVYWRINITPPEAGSYLLNIRTTSTMADGTERVCDRNTQFLFTVN